MADEHEEQEEHERRTPQDRRQHTDRRFEARVAQASEKDNQKQFLSKFETDSDKRLARFFVICLLLSLASGFYFTVMEIIIPEILEAQPEDIVAVADFKEKKKEKKEEKKEKPKPRKKRGGGGKPKGKRTHENMNGVGVLKLITSKTSSSAHTAYNLMESKFSDIDKSLDKIAALKTTGNSRFSGRKGKNNAGFNEGFAAGGTGGIDDMLGGLLGGDDMRVGTQAKGKLSAPSASEIDMGAGGSRRSAASILRVVRQHMPGLRHTYNKYLKKHPGFGGKIHIKFEIAPSGSVVRVSQVSSTTGVPAFDSEINTKVRRWRFEPITGKGNDIVTIPFTFSE